MKGKGFFSRDWNYKGLLSRTFFNQIRQVLLRLCALLIPVFLFSCVSLVVYDFGFNPFWAVNSDIDFWVQQQLYVTSVLMGLRLFLTSYANKRKWARLFNFFGWVFLLFLTFYILPEIVSSTNFSTNRFLFYKLLLYAGIILAFLTELSYLLQFIYTRSVNPALLFVASFAFLILIGAFMLSMPNATTTRISKLDALFTSASAVCVTGLIVVDTATQFTTFGQLMLLVLIQVGALGIMTFAGLLAYAIAGGSSLRSQLAFGDMMSTRQVGSIMRFIYKVILVTIFFEGIGAFCIYFSLDDNLEGRKLDKVFFSIFHSVSAFCNAGFSTLTNGLYEDEIRFNYNFQFFISLLIILGGMGFPIVFNVYNWISIKAGNLYRLLIRHPKHIYLPRLINLNSRLALVVSGLLIILGFITYAVFEPNASLQQHPTFVGKLVTCFFGSVTPRTAGFNTVDMTSLSLPTVMIYLLMMWIGASPGSTGGGIKTTTIGVAILNMLSVLKGKDRTEFFKSEVSNQSIRRAFALIVLSLLFIGVSVFLISINDSDKGLLKIAFEAFSAFSTVGLSLGITADLSKFSKVVIILTMFIGRVGTVTLLAAFIKQSKALYYRYPKEDITF